MDWIEAVPLDKIFNGGGWTLAFTVVLYVARMVYTGRLVPRRTHEDTVNALATERKRNELLLQQLGKATDSMEVFEAFVRSLPQAPPQAPLRIESQQGQPRRAPRRRDRRAAEWEAQWGEWAPPPGDGDG